MIYTVTFNPALDYVVFLDDLKLGDVNRSTRESIFYGGKGINVSTILNTLGLETTALGFIAGFTGKAIEDGLASQGIHTDFIHLPEGNSRINVKVKHGDETEINGQGPVITDEAINGLFAKLDTLTKEDILVLAGSIPNTLPEDIYEKILARLESKGIRIVVDATKDLLLNVLKYHPFLIKPNNHELGEMFGTVCKTDEDIIHYAKKLQEMGAVNVLISMAGDGAILITEDGQNIKMGTPKGKVVNSVGAGDSMVAGFVAGYLRGGSYEEALKSGTAASGRPCDALERLFAPVKDRMFFLSDNGARGVYQGRELYADAMTLADCFALVEDTRNLEGCQCVWQTSGKTYFEKGDEEIYKIMTESMHYSGELVNNLMEVTIPALKYTVYHPEDAEKATEGEFSEKWKVDHQLVCAGHNFMDVMNLEANKGNGLAKIQEYLNITKEETMAFGDNINDLEMLGNTAYSYAVGDAREEVRQAARFTAPPMTQDGVLQILKTLL